MKIGLFLLLLLLTALGATATIAAAVVDFEHLVDDDKRRMLDLGKGARQRLIICCSNTVAWETVICCRRRCLAFTQAFVVLFHHSFSWLLIAAVFKF